MPAPSAVASTDNLTHLFRRAEFTARPERLPAPGATYAQAIARILDGFQPAVAGPDLSSTSGWEQYVSATQWWYDRMVRVAARPFQEKLAMFWHGHFCSDWGKVDEAAWMVGQNQLFRSTAMGNFRTLAKAVARTPAMLRYLDNDQNRKRSPNQNLAREMIELFLLGVGNYTEADVEAATRAFTGHTIRDGAYAFVADQHDDGDKTFLGVRGRLDLDDIIDIVLGFRTQGGARARVQVGPNAGVETRVVAARFLSKKLWEAFAYERPSATIVNALANVLVVNGFTMRPWIEAMFLRDEFYSTTARRGLVRTPTEYVVDVLYRTNLTAGVGHPEWWAGDMGQALFRPPNVSGWRPNGYWVNASAMAARASFAGYARWKLYDDDERLVLRGGSWTWHALETETPARFVDILQSGLGASFGAATRQALLAFAERERSPWSRDGAPIYHWSRSANGLQLALVTPEMNLA